MSREVYEYIKKNPILIIILVVGWIVNLSLVFPIKAHLGHDTYWHLALIDVAFQTFPPQIPIYAGESLRGYNYLIDVVMFLFTKAGISSVYVYVVLIPFLYLISMTFLTIYFAKRFDKSINFVASFVFFTFLATPFSYMLSYYRRGNPFHGFEFPTVMQSSTTITNIAHACTLPLILVVLILFQKKKFSLMNIVTLGLLTGAAFGIKFYGGAVMSLLVYSYLFFLVCKDRNIIQFIRNVCIVLFFSGISIIFFYDPFSSVKTGSIFGYAPMAIIRPLIEDPDALYIRYFVMARYTLIDAGGFSPRLLAIDTATLALYILYNAGTRFLGFFMIAKRIWTRKITMMELSMIVALIGSGVMATLFVQKGGDWWNTVQFFGYSLFFLNFFAAQFISGLSKKLNAFTVSTIALIVLLTMPLNIELIQKSIQSFDDPVNISQAEQEGLDFLQKLPNGSVFTVPVAERSSYIPAYIDKPVYFADEQVISNIGIDYSARKKMVTEDLKSLDVSKLPVEYFYLLKKDPDYVVIRRKINANKNIKKVFANEAVEVFQSL